MYQQSSSPQQQQQQQQQQQTMNVVAGPTTGVGGGGTTPTTTTTTTTTTTPPNIKKPTAPLSTSADMTSAVPTLKVMRLQSPDFHQPNAGMLGGESMLGMSLCLPDSFGVIHIGETFTAYLGALNVSNDLPIRRLTVAATLQTPSRRYPLPSNLDASNNAGGIDIPPRSAIDAIVSRPLEEVGQHILRVEVGYTTSLPPSSLPSPSSAPAPTTQPKTLRKFYRFNVASPLHIRELTLRGGDACCFVSIAIENASAASSGGSNDEGSLTITGADFQPPFGLVAEKIGGPKCSGETVRRRIAGDDGATTTTSNDIYPRKKRDLYDDCGTLPPGASFRYLFVVKAESQDAALRGIACGDELGKAVFSWRKAFGDVGRIASTSVLCPPSYPGLFDEGGGERGGGGGLTRTGSTFVVHGSGLSVDVAASAANRGTGGTGGVVGDQQQTTSVDDVLPITVEPIDPPTAMTLGVPQTVQLLIVNHSDATMDLQLQMRLPHMSGVVVCGPSFRNLGEVGPNGGSCVVGVTLVALVAGLFRMQGCWIVDLATGREISQPPLFNIFVEKMKGVDGGKLEDDDEKKV